MTDLTFLTQKQTNCQSNIFMTSYRIYLWLRYKTKATESMQITLQILKYVVYADMTHVLWLVVASAPKSFIDVILLQLHCSQGQNLGGEKGFFLQM